MSGQGRFGSCQGKVHDQRRVSDRVRVKFRFLLVWFGLGLGLFGLGLIGPGWDGLGWAGLV